MKQKPEMATAPPLVSTHSAGSMMPPPCRFGTYMGKSGTTRASETGNITSVQVLAQKQGFGVFAYYTGGATYGQHQVATYTTESYTGTASVSEKYPNFMYNQQVTGTDEAIPVWSYEPIKYWPNDFANSGAVDDLTTPAQGSSTYGGNVSFFAYAPYVSSLDANVGITAMSANDAVGDPTVTYTITDGTNTSNTDLLWGTLANTNVNVLNVPQNGVSGDNDASNDNNTSRTYAQSILGSYTTNADLNKQKVEGKVGFAFKHALAGLGGGSGVGTGTNVGFQVILDIDKDGEVTGGFREQFKVTSDNDAWRTIVTIKDIEISNDLNGDGDADDSGEGEVKLAKKGTLNLATGQWSVEDGDKGVVKHTIGTGSAYNAVLNTKIAEMYDASNTWYTHASSSNATDYFVKTLTEDATKEHPGVIETAQNVYNDATQSPIMFIPGQTPTIRVTVEYVVRTYDANLVSTKPYSDVTQKISKTITFGQALQLNKRYNLLMHLGLTGIKFTATVSNWEDTGTIGDSDGNGSDDNDVYVPINVK